MRNGKKLDNHVIREKRKECERKEKKIEKGRGRDKKDRVEGGGLLKNRSCFRVLNLFKMYIVKTSLFCS